MTPQKSTLDPHRRVTALAVTMPIVLMALLSGCTMGNDSHRYAIFDRESKADDAPSPDISSQEFDGVDLESLRFAAEYETDRLYLAKAGGDRGGICLLIDGPKDEDAWSACSTGDWVEAEGVGGSAYRVQPEGTQLLDEGYVSLTENISVNAGK